MIKINIVFIAIFTLSLCEKLRQFFNRKVADSLSLIHTGVVIASHDAADAITTRTNDGQFTLNDFAR